MEEPLKLVWGKQGNPHKVEEAERREAERVFWRKKSGSKEELQSKVAEALFEGITKKGCYLEDYPDSIKTILRREGVQKIGATPLGKLSKRKLIDYAYTLLRKEGYCSDTNFADF